MPGREHKTSRMLVLICVLLSAGCAGLLTESSSAPYVSDSEKSSDIIVAENLGSLESPGGVLSGTGHSSGKEDQAADGEKQPDEGSEQALLSVSPSPAAVVLAAAGSSYEVSDEAARGVWSWDGSGWLFMVDGVPYSGWLNDKDGKRYHLGSDGYMQTGWVKDDGRRFYMDDDGIMQTGEVRVGKSTYLFAATGELIEEVEPTPVPVEAPASDKEAEKAAEGSGEDSGQEDGDTSSGSKIRERETVAAVSAVNTSMKAGKASVDPDGESKAKDTKKKSSDRGMIALTFDDGPSDFTDALLDCLEKYNARATFFLVGKEIENFPDAVRRMEELGCEVGNHSYDHTDLTRLTKEEMQEEIGKVDALLTELIGHSATVLRPPYGNYDDTVRLLADRPLVLWSVDTMDWDSMNTRKTLKAALDGAHDGAVILMHDIYRTSVKAAIRIIPELIEEGYQLVTIHELAAAKGAGLANGDVYAGS